MSCRKRRLFGNSRLLGCFLLVFLGWSRNHSNHSTPCATTARGREVLGAVDEFCSRLFEENDDAKNKNSETERQDKKGNPNGDRSFCEHLSFYIFFLVTRYFWPTATSGRSRFFIFPPQSLEFFCLMEVRVGKAGHLGEDTPWRSWTIVRKPPTAKPLRLSTARGCRAGLIFGAGYKAMKKHFWRGKLLDNGFDQKFRLEEIQVGVGFLLVLKTNYQAPCKATRN